jgi:hypothetical protein
MVGCQATALDSCEYFRCPFSRESSTEAAPKVSGTRKCDLSLNRKLSRARSRGTLRSWSRTDYHHSISADEPIRDTEALGVKVWSIWWGG